uniref:PsbP C-terminal domain-containing protein n=1 Tax=Oryza meridionalis TaxID=40149 RepID=A0A0E0EKL9_9ORYZ
MATHSTSALAAPTFSAFPLAAAARFPCASATSNTCAFSLAEHLTHAAEAKKGFLPVTDKKDGYSFLYPFGWQEVVVQGQDKVYKDVIEPLESVSVNTIPTSKQDIRELGPPDQI